MFLRRESNYVCKRKLRLELTGRGSEDVVKEDMMAVGVNEENVRWRPLKGEDKDAFSKCFT